MYGTRYQTDEQLRRENRRLQDELDRARIEREQAVEHQDQERERRQRAYRQEREALTCSASDWPEAFRKNRYRMERERNECRAAADEPEEYQKMMNDLRANWDGYLADIDRATAIWAEEQQVIDEAIRQMRERVAARLRAENPKSELADYIAEDDIDGWMNW